MGVSVFREKGEELLALELERFPFFVLRDHVATLSISIWFALEYPI